MKLQPVIISEQMDQKANAVLFLLAPFQITATWLWRMSLSLFLYQHSDGIRWMIDMLITGREHNDSRWAFIHWARNRTSVRRLMLSNFRWMLSRLMGRMTLFYAWSGSACLPLSIMWKNGSRYSANAIVCSDCNVSYCWSNRGRAIPSLESTAEIVWWSTCLQFLVWVRRRRRMQYPT